MILNLFSSFRDSMTHLFATVTQHPQAAVVGAVIGAVIAQSYKTLPIELPTVIAIGALVFIDTRTGIKAAKKRGEDILSGILRVRLCNKAAAYSELYIAGLAARTISANAGSTLYGMLMGIIASVEIWSILENLHATGQIPVNPNKSGVLLALRSKLFSTDKEDQSE